MRAFTILLLPLFIAGLIIPSGLTKKVISPMFAARPDGPYVLYKNGFVHTKYVQEENGNAVVKADSFALADKSSIVLRINTDIQGKQFTVKLKDQLKNEQTEFPDAKKIFVVSDIEGSFKAFRKILQGNKVIDSDFNWTFGDGHLVLTGDFVDRGDLVTEVLWLIYSLEEKAKAAGGYVHFILGNHEIMNMSGDLRYLNKKYVDNASLLNEKFVMLYGEESELGRWFRTKNVTERVGDILFVHGGISDLVNRMNVTPALINELVRPYYADTTFQYSDRRLDTLYSDWGPFWYRGYYMGSKASVNQIDSTLQQYGVKHIATGHSVIADTISMLHGGKLFNTDVHHAKGFSEALLVEDKKFYRVNSGGERFLLLSGK